VDGSVDWISAVCTAQSDRAPHGASTLVPDFHRVRFPLFPSRSGDSRGIPPHTSFCRKWLPREGEPLGSGQG